MYTHLNSKFYGAHVLYIAAHSEVSQSKAEGRGLWWALIFQKIEERKLEKDEKIGKERQ